MIFRHGFFHGDPHPANILELPDGSLGLVDFGQVGKLSNDDMEKLTRLFIDAARENVSALPRRLGDLGVKYDRTREAEFVDELRELYDRYYGTRLSEIDPLTLIRDGLALIYRLNLRLPARFVMLDKALATLGSVGAELYPDFNVFEVARPYARGLLVERFAPGRLAARARADARSLGAVLVEAPYQVSDMLEAFRDGQVEIGFRHQGLDDLARNLDRITNRVVIALIGAAGVVGSAILGALGDSGWSQALAFTGFTLSFLLGVWLVWGVARSGRL
jgi:ubiquinone biosynthesis protein